LSSSENLIIFDADGNITGFGLTEDRGLDTLIGGAGNDKYSTSVAGVVIDDTSGIDDLQLVVRGTLGTESEIDVVFAPIYEALSGDPLLQKQLKETVKGFMVASKLTLSTDIEKIGTTLIIDINADRHFDLAKDVSILNFFNAAGGAGVGFIEKIEDFSGQAFLDQFKPITGTNGNNTINGTGHADNISSLGGNDIINSKAGLDTLSGGLGNDLYIIDADTDFGLDHIIETAGGGIDTLDYQSSSAAVIVNLTATATQVVAANVKLAAVSLNQIENVYGGVGKDSLTGNSLNNHLRGGAGNDSLSGGLGNDTLEGGNGSNNLIGGAGNDLFIVDADVDTGLNKIVELAAGGLDTLDFRGTTTKNITANLGIIAIQTIATGLQLTTPTIGIENVYGGAVNDKLIGNAFNNHLWGGAGNDTLDGGVGVDSMVGGLGNDTYVIDRVNDVITESVNGGTDTVNSTVNYVLGANIEKLNLLGIANINGTGNALVMQKSLKQLIEGGSSQEG
jgi:Ca2+-binding RTX toxin-like protein